jgi:hypothetical protein
VEVTVRVLGDITVRTFEDGRGVAEVRTINVGVTGRMGRRSCW